MPLFVGAVLLVLVGVVLIVLALHTSGASPSMASEPITPRKTRSAKVVAGTIEAPSLIGSRIEDAQLVLDTAGFKVYVTYRQQADTPTGTVLSQEPMGRTLVPTGSAMHLVVAGSNGAGSGANAKSASSRTAQADRYIVVVDPGHQAHSDQTLEPVGPGSSVKKARSTGGTTGSATHIPEYEIALQISTNLAARLRRAGVKVIMTRTTNDVTLSNSERAAIANRANADLFIRIHANGSPDQGKSGISTLYSAANEWRRRFSSNDESIARTIQGAILAATDASNDGVHARSDLAGFNYAKVPSVLVECGFMSNPVEDRLLASPHYQDKVAQGIADGILASLEKTR